MFDEEQAQFVCDFLECLTCSSGVPLRLMDWQRSMITEFYGQLIEDEDDPAGSYLRRYQYLYLEIAKKNLYAVEERGDLETRNWDGADFFEVSVWGLKKALEEAYLLGKGK